MTNFTTERFLDEPLIPMGDLGCHEFDRFGYANVNGPSVIRVPEWVPNPLGKYYLYFAHHKGTFIRMAYSDSVSGPYTIYKPGALQLKDSNFPVDPSEIGTPAGVDPIWHGIMTDPIWSEIITKYKKTSGSPQVCHIASPDVIIDHERKQFVMTFHGLEGKPMKSSQLSRVAVSRDGLHFQALPGVVGFPYMRHFKNPFDPENNYYIAMPGVFYKSKDGLANFECRELDGRKFNRDSWLFDINMRHAACLVIDKYLHVFWTRVEDAPERILVTTIELDKDWMHWRVVKDAQDVMRPELPWEGAELPAEPSVRGEIYQIANELRDPFVFREDDGQLYLFYAGGGETNIGVVKLLLS